jgi:hypothetical protein
MSNYPTQSTDENHHNGTPGATNATGSKALGVVGLVFAFLVSPIGLIISIIAMVKARRSGTGKGFALAGIVVGIIGTAILAIGAFVLMSLVPNFVELAEQCKDLAPGTTVQVSGETVPCP